MFGEDYEKYEAECSKIRETNAELLRLFEDDMKAKGLSDSTIRKHLSNVDFYINEYLLREDALSMDHGAYMTDSFLGEFFIRHCVWSTPASIKATAASIKKFYQCMLEHKKIVDGDYAFLCSEIKDNMDEWQNTCEIYNDPSQPNPFAFF